MATSSILDTAFSTESAIPYSRTTNGAIRLAGTYTLGTTRRAALAQFTTAGVLDTSFDRDGKALSSTPLSFSTSQFSTVSIGSNGGAIYTGTTTAGDFGVARYYFSSPSNFNLTTVVDFGGTEAGNAVAVRPDGGFAVVGSTSPAGLGDFAVARFNSNGSLNTGFDGDGKTTTGFTLSTASARLGGTSGYVVALPNGQFLVAGTVLNGTDQADFVVTRLNSNGSIDTTYGVAGRAVIDFGGLDFLTAIALDNLRRAVVVGSAANGFDDDIAITRLNADGTLDTNFGTGGIVFIDLGDNDLSSGLVIGEDDEIILVGTTQDLFTGIGKIGLVRLKPSGNLDANFGIGGKLILDIGGNATGTSIALTASGKLLVGGTRLVGPDAELAVLQLFEDEDECE